MDWYVYVAWVLIVLQALFSLHVIKNYYFVLAKYRKQRDHYEPLTALIIPCKNLDTGFEQNISSFYRQDYVNYLLWFVVEGSNDPAYGPLCNLKEKIGKDTKAKEIRVLVAGTGQICSQKIHNLLYAYRQVPNNVEVLAFADSDISVKSHWLRHLVYPLRLENRGATTGYRWFVPGINNFATLVLSALNAKVAQLLGNTIWNQTWGGSMAIKTQTFRDLRLDVIWQKAVSDDLSLSYAVKKTRKKVEFVPGCIVASYETTTWSKLFEFARRQFLITRVTAPGTWLFGLVTCFCATFGLWGGAGLAVYAVLRHIPHIWLFTAIPVIFFIAQLSRALLRQNMASKLFAEDWPKLRAAAAVDIALFWLWSPIMLILILSSAFGRTIRWRGITYKMLGPTETIVLDS